ncbi:MAG: hypothetical protein GF311_04855 [Candidatus Lokiarchaeota archaeon]|nr:hypothetical protein [Candidatus Lokiarchaeota archaeon]
MKVEITIKKQIELPELIISNLENLVRALRTHISAKHKILKKKHNLFLSAHKIKNSKHNFLYIMLENEADNSNQSILKFKFKR